MDATVGAASDRSGSLYVSDSLVFLQVMATVVNKELHETGIMMSEVRNQRILVGIWSWLFQQREGIN